MNQGRIEQVGTPQELYHHPKTRFVAGFIGSPAMNFIPCRLERNGSGMRVRVSDAIALPVPESQAPRCRSAAGRDLILGLRPEHLTEPRRSGDEGCAFPVTLDVVEPLGMETMVFFSVNGSEVCARVDPAAARGPGDTMRLAANVEHMHLIDPATDAVL
jgi:multiple sugar transport system ATP-binding protein